MGEDGKALVSADNGGREAQEVMGGVRDGCKASGEGVAAEVVEDVRDCLLYTSPSPRDS